MTDRDGVRPGRPYPLGATVCDVNGVRGTNFAVSSMVAEAMTLCLFDNDGAETRIPMADADAGVWHVFVPGVGAGQRYGFRADGLFDPSRGLRTNPAKLLADPYARAMVGDVTFGPAILGYDPADDVAPSMLDSAGQVMRSLVVDPGFDWGDETRPEHQLADSVIYEVHVKGFTMQHPAVPAALQGTYDGLAHEAVIGHLVDLGVTAVELLPIHQHVPEASLVARGLTNYWGYSTLGFFAPHAGYSAAVRAGQPGGQVVEFQRMVAALHDAGLEVLLDVVFNHTCEGGADGPTLSFRGLDNPAYYWLDPADPSQYVDTTGCGHSLNANHPTCIALIMDSLRYWVNEMHVDGFRFDLAPTLARDEVGFDPSSAFFDVIAQDPVVSRVKLIAEPWDVGRADSYGLGRFPPSWSEWNGRYRDTMRDFWRAEDGTLGDFATRFAGSSDLFGASRRRPTASINLITVHDGFTLRDLVSYDQKHNDANGENNRDGADDNRSWNGGVEGDTDDPRVLAGRGRRARAMLTTLLLSFGVPLLLGGDELGRTQRGNNNAYCQDNDITWFDWSAVDDEMLAFTRRVVALRRGHPVFRRKRFLSGIDAAELAWFAPTGRPMTSDDWADPRAHTVAIVLDGNDAPDRSADGTVLVDDDFLVLVNGWREGVTFTVPPGDQEWTVELRTEVPEAPSGPVRRAGDAVTLGPESVVVLRSPSRREG